MHPAAWIVVAAALPTPSASPSPTAVPASGFYDAGFGRFLISPGFGGVAALLAALVAGGVAWFVARRQSDDSHSRAITESEAVRQQRWWEFLTWLYTQATAERKEARLTADLALDLLERLYEEAHTDLEIQVARGLIGIFGDEATQVEDT